MLFSMFFPTANFLAGSWMKCENHLQCNNSMGWPIRAGNKQCYFDAPLSRQTLSARLRMLLALPLLAGVSNGKITTKLRPGPVGDHYKCFTKRKSKNCFFSSSSFYRSAGNPIDLRHWAHSLMLLLAKASSSESLSLSNITTTDDLAAISRAPEWNYCCFRLYRHTRQWNNSQGWPGRETLSSWAK